MAKITRLKRGDTFRATAVYRDKLGQTVDLVAEGVTAKSSVLCGSKRYPLTCTVLPQNDLLTRGKIRVEGSMADWPTGEASWDVQFTKQLPGDEPYVFSSETVPLMILEDITR